MELRSVNHRYFELQTHLPGYLADLEDRLRERLKRYVRRGRINLSLTVRRRNGEAAAITVDAAVARRYHALLVRLQSSLKLRGEISVDQILALPKVVTVEEQPNNQAALGRLAEAALVKAAKALVAMRRREGRALARDVLLHLGTIERSLNGVETHAPQVVAAHRARLTKRVQELAQGVTVDRQRLETEIALFADAHDISEEIARLRSHLAAVRHALADGAEAGRRLDFLAQELFRETNTIGAKAADTAITTLVIAMKGAIEKLREQIQNIE